jgi:hypothetical protein
MPKYFFNDEDIFHNVLRARPKFTIQFYLNNAYINKEISQGVNLPNGSISYFQTSHDFAPFTPYIIWKSPDNTSDDLYPKGNKEINPAAMPQAGEELTASLPLASSIARNIIISGANGPQLTGGVSFQRTVEKVQGLKSVYNLYAPQSPYFNFDKYLMKNDGAPVELALVSNQIPPFTVVTGVPLIPKYINLIEVPRLFKDSRIERGTLNLKFYYTGTLIGAASDVTQNGTVIETHGPRTGSVIGTVMYKEGLILLTASYDLSTNTDGYLSPQSGTFADPTTVPLDPEWSATASWAHFGAYKSFITTSLDLASSSFAPASSSYVLEFEGVHKMPTVLMMAHAQKNELNWSNNPTFVERKGFHDSASVSYADIYVSSTGSQGYIEKGNIAIKNTVSSSFCDYSESYKPQTYISKIGVYDKDADLIAIAKFANPIRKTNEQDYTFKLKLDL